MSRDKKTVNCMEDKQQLHKYTLYTSVYAVAIPAETSIVKGLIVSKDLAIVTIASSPSENVYSGSLNPTMTTAQLRRVLQLQFLLDNL